MQKINIRDCSTVEISIDEVAKLLFWEDRIFRVISEQYIMQVKDMLDGGLINELIEKNLFPKTWISDVTIENNELILEHEKIYHWNYPYEWSFDMLKDAGLAILEVNKIANKYGYEIMDAHAYNVTFNMNKPQYIDFGSFKKVDREKSNNWISYNIFYNHFYISLYLWSKELSDVARNIFLMRDYFDEYEFYKIKYPALSFVFGRKLYNFFKNIKKVSLTSNLKILEKLKNPVKQKLAIIINSIFKDYFASICLEKQIKSFSKPKENSMWNDYHNSIDPASTKRFIRIKEIIETLKDANTLVELASNQGKFAEFVLDTTHINKVIGTDYDKEAVNIMYNNNKHRENFLPLLFDMVRTNGRRIDEAIDKRIKSDIVVALAVTHHLLLTQNISIDFIFNTMSKLTNKYIIVEFMPIGLYGGDLNKIPPLPEFYKLDWFKENFLQYFDLILDEELEMNRHVFVGKLKGKN